MELIDCSGVVPVAFTSDITVRLSKLYYEVADNPILQRAGIRCS